MPINTPINQLACPVDAGLLGPPVDEGFARRVERILALPLHQVLPQAHVGVQGRCDVHAPHAVRRYVGHTGARRDARDLRERAVELPRPEDQHGCVRVAAGLPRRARGADARYARLLPFGGSLPHTVFFTKKQRFYHTPKSIF